VDARRCCVQPWEALRRDAADPDKAAGRDAAIEAGAVPPDAAVAPGPAWANAAAVVALISRQDPGAAERWDARRAVRPGGAGPAEHWTAPPAEADPGASKGCWADVAKVQSERRGGPAEPLAAVRQALKEMAADSAPDSSVAAGVDLTTPARDAVNRLQVSAAPAAVPDGQAEAAPAREAGPLQAVVRRAAKRGAAHPPADGAGRPVRSADAKESRGAAYRRRPSRPPPLPTSFSPVLQTQLSVRKATGHPQGALLRAPEVRAA
jgi:hypothetical protein